MICYDFYMNKIKISFIIFIILFGIFLFVYGGYDDSPGAQLLGVMAIISGIVGLTKKRFKN